MKQTSFLIVFLVACVAEIFSAPIDTAVTRLIASNFYASRVQPAADRSPAPVQLAYTGKIRIPSQQDSTNCFYVYNVGGGYVIVSADDRFEPVLGYSNKGSFQPSAMPPAMIELLSDYQEEMRAILDSGTSPCNNVLQRWMDLYSGNQQHLRYGAPMVGPLLTTTWDQSGYYSSLCPVDSANYYGHAITGCAATAMAQIVRYWQYPSHGIGSHSYTHNTYGVLSVDFSSATYDYANMPNSLNYNSTSSEIFQVAQLLYHCGVSINMNYGPGASGASIYSVASALNTYFGYSGCHVKSRSSYSDADWVNLLKTSLDALQPIFYVGTSSTSGHAFVFDGYDSEDYFHINWGWEGSCDGYFLVSSLTPCGGYYDFTSDQMAILGISASMPIIRPDKKSIPFLTEYGTISEVRSVDILTNRLTSPVTATVTSGFQISVDSLNYSSSVFVDSSGGKVYVRFVPTASEVTEYGNLLLSSGTTMDTVMLYGSSYIARCVPPENLIVTSQDMQHVTIQWDSAVDHSQQILSWGSDEISSYSNFGTNMVQIMHRYCDTDLVKIHGKSLTAIDLYLVPNITLCKAVVYKGGFKTGTSYNPGNLVVEQTLDLNSMTVNAWNTVILNTPVEIDATRELWFGFYIEMASENHSLPLCQGMAPGKGNVYAYHYPSGNIYWHTGWDDRAFCIKGRVKDIHSPSHYEVYRDSTLIANTSSLSWNDTVDEIKTYLYTVVSEWASGCTSSAQRYFSNVPHIDASPEALDFYTRYGLDNKVKSMVVTGNGLASNIQATVSGHFLISTDSLQFGTTASLSSQGGVLYVKYVPSSANTPFETGAIHFQSGSISADIPLTGQCYEPCSPPENLTLIQTDNRVDLHWDVPELFVPRQSVLSWSAENPSSFGGYSSDMKLYMMYRFEPVDLSDYHNMLLKKISFIPRPFATAYKLVVYKGGSYNGSTYDPGTMVVEQNVPISTLTEYEWNTIALDNPVAINANEELWYGVYVEAPAGTYPITYNYANNPHKGGIIKVVAPYSVDWTEYSNSRSFVMKALVEDCPRTCTHYQMERNEDWIGTTTTNDYTDYPFFNGLNHYAVWSVWDNGCKAPARGSILVSGLCTQPGITSVIEVCDNYQWHENIYSTSGTYYHTFLNNGCTQIDTLHLTVVPLQSETHIVICENDLPYTYGDTVFGIGTPNLSVHHFQRVSTHGCDSIVTLTLTVNPLPSVSITGATEFCDGGSTTLTVVGAANYVWSNTSTSLSITVAAPGNYSVTGTDANGCSNTASVPVVEHPVYSTPVNVSIQEGQTYWFHGQPLTAAGTYSHTLQSVYGCDSVVVLHLSVMAHPLVNVSRTAYICQGETYNFYGQALTSPGMYMQTVSNASADTLVTLTLSVNPLPVVTISGATEFCDGGSTTLTAGGAVLYAWNTQSTTPSITVIAPGTYTVTGTDANGCSNVANTTVSLQAVSYSEVTVENTGPYSWNGITYSSSGDYIQTLTGSNGCDSVVILHLNILVGIADYSTALYKVFPNPTKNFVYVQLAGKSELRTAYVYDVYGQLLIQLDADDDHVEIDLTPFANGLYFIKAIGNHNQILGVKRVLKE